MRFSPNTLNSVIAVLSVDGVTGITPDRLNAALQALLGEANTSLDLLPGEYYYLEDEEDDNREFRSRTEMEAYIEQIAEERDDHRSYRRDLDDYLTLTIVRRQITLESTRKIEVTFS
jgi:cytochrome P450